MIYDGNYYVGSDLNGDSLSHHGVPNQRWGVKHGPPYPIQAGHEVHYKVGKMTAATKNGLQKAGKIAGEKVTNAAKTVAKKTSSAFQKWKEDTKNDLVLKDTNNRILKNWQKKQLRVSDMTNQELQQRIDRKKLEETYKRALCGDFSDPKTWNKSPGNGKNNAGGKEAAQGILKRFGNAAIDGFTKGLSTKIEQSMTASAKAKVARREARRDAIAEVLTNAAKERAQYNADKHNEEWKARQERRAEAKQERRDRAWQRAQAYGDGAMDPIMGWSTGSSSSSAPSSPIPSSGYLGGSSGKPTGTYYYADPDDWRIH